MDTLGKRLKELREKKELKQEELLKLFNNKYNFTFTKSTLSLYENNKRTPDIFVVKCFADFFNVTIDFLMGSEESKVTSNATPVNSEVVRIPVLGKISAGLPVLALENIEGYEFVSRHLLNRQYEYFYLRIDGDSMNLKMQHGDLLLIQRQNTLDNGEIGVVLINGYDATVKKVYITNNIIQLIPMSNNNKHLPQIYDMLTTDVKIIGKGIYVTSKL